MVAVASSGDNNTLCIQYIMPSAHLYLREEEVVKLMLEFLHNRQLHISQLSVEREAGIINASLSDDLLFLRQLILDGQWDDTIEFVQPLMSVESFNSKRFHYEVLKVKYVELLCIKSEAGAQDNMEQAVEEVVKVLNDLEKYCDGKEEYAALCLLLTLPRLGDHSEYRDWNPSAARVACFRAVLPLVEKFLPSERKRGGERQDECASNDRLIQLLIKGILYESCVEYCQHKATSGGADAAGEMQFSKVLSGNGFSDSDLSLLSWLQSIPSDTFGCPFEQRTLNVDVERLERPQLDAFWTEYMLVTPIKPKTFPHSVMPQARPKSADVMSRSLNPQLEGLPLGLGATRAAAAGVAAAADAMSQSLASFHLTGRKMMNTSVDRLFDSETAPAGELATIAERHEPLASQPPPPPPPPPKSTASTAISSGSERSSSIGSTRRPAPATPSDSERGERVSRPVSEASESPQSTRRRSDAAHHPAAAAAALAAAAAAPAPAAAAAPGAAGAGGDLYQEFQRNRHRLQEQLAEHEQRRNQYVQQLSGDNRYSEDGYRQTAAQHSPAHPIYGQTNGAPRPGPPGHHPAGAVHHHPSAPAETHPVTGPMATPISATPLRQPMPVPSNGVYQAVNISRGMSPSLTPQRAPPSHTSIMTELPPDPAGLQAGIYDANKTEGGGGVGGLGGAGRPRFIPVTSLEDVQAIRCAEFHPHGKLYAVGSNSKTLRICSYPKLTDLRDDHVTYQPTVLFKRTKHHKGSIYCLAWSPVGDLIATGSNDKTIKLMRFNSDTCNIEGQEIDLTMHDGTVRDLCFIEDMSNKSSLLISGGAGDCKIYVTDCVTGTPFQALSGHSGHILSLYTWGGAMFVSGSHDRTVRFWDLRSRGCVNMFHPPSVHAGSKGSAVASVAVDPSGRLLVTGHEDASCNLYDIRGGRNIQSFKPHESDVRSVRFSPSAYYLLTGGYDNRTVLTDLQGDLTMPLPSVIVAEHQDKVITGRWHPNEFSFISTGADKTCTLWALPPL